MEESNVTIRKHCATDRIPLARSLLDVVGSQYRQTERQRETDTACVNLWVHPAGSSVLFIGPSSLCALLPHWPHLHFSPIQKTNFHSPSCFPLIFLTHTHTLTHPWCLRLHPESELLSTFSVGWAALPPWGKRTRGGSQTSCPSFPWWNN